MLHRYLYSLFCLTVAAGTWHIPAFGAEETLTPAESTDVVRMDFPDQVDVRALVDYASATLGINILYDESIQNKKVTIRSPESVPKDSLLDLVRSVLQTKGLMLVEAEQPGWLRVAPATELQQHAREVQDGQLDRPGSPMRVVTHVFRVRSHNVERITAALKPFASGPGASMLVLGESMLDRTRTLIAVTDFEASLARIELLIKLMDSAAPESRIRFVRVSHAEPADLAALAAKILSEKAKGQDGQQTAGPAVLGSPRSGQIILVGPDNQLDEAEELIRQFDVARELVTRRYTPKYATADRVRSLIEQLIFSSGGMARTDVQIVADTDSNSLYLAAPEAVHHRVETLIQQLDQAPPDSRRPVRFYRPKHRRADELLDTLNRLLGQSHLTGSMSGTSVEGGSNGFKTQDGLSTTEQVGPEGLRVTLVPKEADGRAPATRPASAMSSARQATSGADYTLTLDQHTNTIIVVATPELHQQIGQLVEQLDQRRPQVLIETTLVVITFDDNLDLGFEFESYRLNGKNADHIVFSAFGLSSVDTNTGQLTLKQDTGLQGAVLSPEEWYLVAHALATHSKSHVVAAPKVLVADNHASTIKSVSESPFTSFNASERFSTTSFAGFADAGTTLTVEPHIAEGDHLEIKYSLTFSSFTGTGSEDGTVPPPRSTNNISSLIQVPDGYTAVIGGLQIDNEGESVSEVPLLGRIPGLGMLFQRSNTTTSKTRLYAFIRPVILRDDQFEDLKFLTEADLQRAELAMADFPRSEPEWIR